MSKTGKGIWVDGNLSEEELNKFQSVLREAVLRAKQGLTTTYKDEKLTFEASPHPNGTLLVKYGWNFPPQELWVKEKRDVDECFKCFPNGFDKEPARETWCQKMGYKFSRCPYGVNTEVFMPPGM